MSTYSATYYRASKPDDNKRTHAVVCAYDCPYGTRGTVLSRHASYALAAKALRRRAPGESGNWLRIDAIA